MFLLLVKQKFCNKSIYYCFKRYYAVRAFDLQAKDKKDILIGKESHEKLLKFINFS